MRELTNKQKKFVDEYLIDLNATQAAARAGYKDPNIGRQLITKNNVAKAIEIARINIANRTLVTQEEIINDLKEIKERCMQRVPVCDKKGNQIQDEQGRDVWAFDAKNANKALELLGRHLGMFVDKKEISGSVTVASIQERIDQNKNEVAAAGGVVEEEKKDVAKQEQPSTYFDDSYSGDDPDE